MELEKAYTEASNDASKLKAKVKYIKEQREKPAFEIKDNILAQCKVICLEVDFGEVKIDKYVMDGHIEVTPVDDDEEGDLEGPKFEPADHVADL